MDIAAYRKQCLADIQKASTGTPARKSGAKAAKKAPAAAVARRAGGPSAGARASAWSLDPSSRETSIQDALALLADDGAATEPRLRALEFIGAAAFDPVAFAPFEARFAEILKHVATSAAPAVRQTALERLALDGDPFVQKLLADGLTGKRPALVPQAKAVQLLGMDVHGGARTLLRRLATQATGKVREEALRSLGGDPKSAPLLARVSADKGEPRVVRTIAAMSLKNAAPARFASLARKIVLDEGEDRRMRSTAMSAIAHVESVRDVAMKPAFAKAVGALVGKRGTPPALKKSARAMLGNDGPRVGKAAVPKVLRAPVANKTALAKAAKKATSKSVRAKVAAGRSAKKAVRQAARASGTVRLRPAGA